MIRKKKKVYFIIIIIFYLKENVKIKKEKTQFLKFNIKDYIVKLTNMNIF